MVLLYTCRTTIKITEWYIFKGNFMAHDLYHNEVVTLKE